MKSYLIHYTKLNERLASALSSIRKLGLEPKIISTWDSDDLLDDTSAAVIEAAWESRVHSISGLLIQNALAASTRSPVNRLPLFKANPIELAQQIDWLKPRPLKKGEISVLFKHFYALSSIALGAQTHGIIFEDDIYIEDSNVPLMISLLHPGNLKGVDYIDLAGGSGLFASSSEPMVNGHHLPCLVDINPPRTRTNACYLVSRSLAAYVVNRFFPLVLPIDWHLQWILNTSKEIKCCWHEPPLVVHGSETGSVVSWRLHA